MNLNEYQQKALETAVYPENLKVIYPALGIAGEAGECADKIKKYLRGDYSMDAAHRTAVALEIGDVLWYCATLANDLGFSLEEVANMNYEKLKSRQERGMLRGNGDVR